MSDSDEDIELLEDIKLLEDALAQQPSTSREGPQTTSRTSPETISDTLPTSTPQESLIHQVFQLNESLLLKYSHLKAQILARLQEIQPEQEEISSKLKLVSKGVKGTPRAHYKRVGYPYFKDAQLFPSPLNEDALLKAKRGELMVVYQRSPSRWTIKDRNVLWMAVRLEAATDYFEKETTKQAHRQLLEAKEKSKSITKTSKTTTKSSKSTTDRQQFDLDVDKCQLPKNYREMIGPLGSREFDWMKIAAQGFSNRHSPEDCRVMWNMYLHPDINRYKFMAPEDRSLIAAAESHGYQDWDAIAKSLNTGRTGYQCFIRYTSIIGPIGLKNKDIPWTARENKILIDLVASLRIGNYIPWSYVTCYIDNRIKNQVYSHWKYNIDPSLRKGRFTPDEDQQLLEGVTKYGKDFPRISTELLPHRTSVQLSGRFTLLMLKTDQSYNSWTVAEDMQLLKLHEELGSDWSKIAGLLKKNRTYVRHRYLSIGRHLAKGRDLSNIPRKRRKSQDDEEYDKMFDQAFVVHHLKEKNQDVDTRLRQYFQRNQAPIAAPGRKTKYFDPEELESFTKGLYDLYQRLDVQLDIPEDVNVEGLTMKDQQLLVSFRDYSCGKGRKDVSNLEVIRKKMFGDDKEDKGVGIEYHIPPAPFKHSLHDPERKGGKKVGKKGGKKGGKAPEKTTDDDCDVVLDFNLEFPENVEKMLKEEESEVFGKLIELLSRPCRLDEVEQKLMMEYEEESDLITNSAITGVSWGKKVGEERSITDVERDKLKFVEPCCATLRGYETLRYMKEVNGNLEWSKGERKMGREPVSAAGKRAFHVLKTRFMRLFKYPIGMAKYAETKPLKLN